MLNFRASSRVVLTVSAPPSGTWLDVTVKWPPLPQQPDPTWELVSQFLELLHPPLTFSLAQLSMPPCYAHNASPQHYPRAQQVSVLCKAPQSLRLSALPSLAPCGSSAFPLSQDTAEQPSSSQCPYPVAMGFYYPAPAFPQSLMESL